MNVCIISKFPPLEGGIAAKTYWLARAYADAGLRVHVISNANTAEAEYKITGCYPHINEIPGVTLHEVEETLPWHIPDEKHSVAKLVDKFLEVHAKHKIDVIDTGYLVPYGIAGYLANRIIGVPYVIRHGGSDIAKFLNQGHLSHLLTETLKNANTVITDDTQKEFFAGLNKQVEVLTPYVPDPNYFFPLSEKIPGPPRLTFIGKINWYWERKGLDLILKTLEYLPTDWDIKIIGQGRGKERFQETFDDKSLEVIPFVPPWEVPHILRESDFVFCLAVDEPIPSFSNTTAEALSCGAKIVILEPVSSNLGISKEHDNIVVVPDAEPTCIAQILQNAADVNNSDVRTKESGGCFHKYIRSNIQVISALK